MTGLLDGKTILLVEDEYLIAIGAKSMLQRLGAGAVKMAHRLEDGLLLAETEAVDAAVLDVNLDGRRSLPIASCLHERNVPYVFATGYSRSDLDLAGEPMLLDKPYTLDKLEDSLRRAMDRPQ
ncbi:response regulator [Parvularcula oceani]|uniref:response regulator n=1 Tax=Parvularcula oceani TaxID=1247963 RepID=UPI0004E130D6|nr:response regulator [Parvularcula oceani]